MKNNLSMLLFAGIAILFLAGCSSQPTDVFENQAETVVASTLTAQTPNEPAPVSTKIPTLTVEPPTSVPFGEIYVFTAVQNVNLRTNPGLLFSVSRVLPQNTRLRLLGWAPGGEWLSVRNDEGIEGWVSMNVVSIGYDGPPPPIIEPTDVYLVTGTVQTEAGIPVSGIGYAILQGQNRTDAKTDDNGQFYAYLPRTHSGTWQVSHVSVSCTSNTMDANCNCINDLCGKSDPMIVAIELPQVNELNFVWK